ncbi:MAG: hypothetical protein BWY63_03219 [Chloroflexi bacterium ADurb.Bin360]|nr:MAG: hypothetical protein BWY63_03219 [Chloroflexi bacterium ADurb.Bin360]
MQVGERITQLVSPSKHLAFIKRFVSLAGLFDQFAQVVSGDKIHDQIFPTLMGEVIGDLRQVGMVKARQNSCFLPELFLDLRECLGFQVAIRRDFFEGANTTRQQQVFGAINGSHTALPDGTNDAVAFLEHYLWV